MCVVQFLRISDFCLAVISVIITFVNSLIIKIHTAYVLLCKIACATVSRIVSEVEFITINSIIRGYYIYKDVWSSFIGEVLYYCCDVHNHHDLFAVAVCKEITVVGHMPWKISAVCYVFLRRLTITGIVMGLRWYSNDGLGDCMLDSMCN